MYESLNQQRDCLIAEIGDCGKRRAIRVGVFVRVGQETENVDDFVVDFHTVCIRVRFYFAVETRSLAMDRNDRPSSRRARIIGYRSV